MATKPVRWTFTPHESWLSRVATYAPYVLFGGFGLLLLLSGIVLAALGTFDVSVLALILVFTLVGGPMSLFYWWILVEYGSNGSKWVATVAGTPHLTKRGIVLATVVGTILIVVSIAVAVELLIALFVGTLLVIVLISPLPTVSELEPEERRLTLGDESRFGGQVVVNLETATTVRRFPLGPFSRWRIIVIRRARGSPLFVPVPDRYVEVFDQTLEDGLESPRATEPKALGTTRPMRIVLAAIGVGFLVIALGFGALVMQTERMGAGRAFMPVGLLVIFALIMLGYAGYETWLARSENQSADD